VPSARLLQAKKLKAKFFFNFKIGFAPDYFDDPALV
jgi:hypothetical protein